MVLEESPGERDGHCIIKNTTYMATKTKDQYISPESEVLEFCSEGENILMASDELYYPGPPDD